MATLAIAHGLYQNAPDASYVLRASDLVAESSYALKDASPVSSTLLDQLTAKVMSRLGTLGNPRMNLEASEILKQFRVAVNEAGADLDATRPLEVIDADDGSVLIEWHHPDRRLGFNIEPEEGHSGWYYAFSRDSGGQCASGMLKSLDMKELLRLILGKPTPSR